MAQSPIVARDVITTELAGMLSAELDFNPSSVILRLVSTRYLHPLSAVISVGVHQRTSPSQNFASAVLGVPPLRISARSPSAFTSHSPWNPGRRVWPVTSCCMVACLRSRFLAINRSSAPISASTSLNAVAIALCSRRVGSGISCPEISERDKPGINPVDAARNCDAFSRSV